MLGPMGIGAVIGKPELLDAMPPYHGGGEMINVVKDTTATYAPLPQKFEAGTPNVEGAIALGAAIAYLRGLGMEAVAAHESDRHARQGLPGHPAGPGRLADRRLQRRGLGQGREHDPPVGR
jgi:cysteine desulfurase/selenocysteine lyase